MSLSDWLTESWQRVQTQPLSAAVRASVYEFYLGLWRAVGDHYQYGTPIYDEDWDVLVVLDGCRADQLDAVRSDYAFVTDSRPTYSVASASEEWMAKNFTPERAAEMAETVYVTGNPFSRDFFTDDDFQVLDEVWRYAWDDDQGTIHPEPLTERAIAHYRAHDPERMIVHYMQPHRPFVTHPEIDSGLEFDFSERSGESTSVWDQLRRGELSREEVNEAFVDNLRYALDDVQRLLSNIDAETVVLTADHGNLLGEHGLYDHPIGVPHPLLRKVPWCPTTARDTARDSPRSKEELTTESESAVTERLESLGYL